MTLEVERGAYFWYEDRIKLKHFPRTFPFSRRLVNTANGDLLDIIGMDRGEKLLWVRAVTGDARVRKGEKLEWL